MSLSYSLSPRTIKVPAHMAGHKRRFKEDKGAEDEIRVAADAANDGIQPVVRINAGNNIEFKSGPGDYYCSFVSSNTLSARHRRLPVIGEAKALHKLTCKLIHSALGANTTINMTQFIQPIDHDDSKYEEGLKWLAAVAMQIYTWLNWLADTPLLRLSCLALLSMFSDRVLTQAEYAQSTAAGAMLVW
ncbi:hypothetical protein N0V93_010309 [Gnomoniopsis smithogilvyi]|uniref:Uncharacterized protein n=1 Tax=Gnomoniopsis smithogilvyi TaxID=1191159 RepID=A0A9W9CSR2_9PEZI|nr:hypothetical protein N0V93_010309 [Gnomoniopsis smithogilvyi]